MADIDPYRGYLIDETKTRGAVGYVVVEPPTDKRTGGMKLASGLPSVEAARERIDTIIDRRQSATRR